MNLKIKKYDHCLYLKDLGDFIKRFKKFVLRQKVLADELLPLFQKEPSSIVDKKALQKWRTIGPFGSADGSELIWLIK